MLCYGLYQMSLTGYERALPGSARNVKVDVRSHGLSPDGRICLQAEMSEAAFMTYVENLSLLSLPQETAMVEVPEVQWWVPPESPTHVFGKNERGWEVRAVWYDGKMWLYDLVW